VTIVKSKFPPQKNQFYPTPPWVTRALLRHVDVVGKRVWEPAAGDHRMADVLRHAGADVLTSDIADYGSRHNLIFDFLDGSSVTEWACEMLITNPPFGARNELAVRFAELALLRCAGTVALLLNANFDFAKTRRHLFADNPRFFAKIALVDRIRFHDGPHHKDGTQDHAWFIWSGQPCLFAPRLIWDGKS
jgi:hypothetical protein